MSEATVKRALKFLETRLREPGPAMHTPADAATYFQLKLATLEHEVFAVMFLDTRHQLIAYEEMFRGTIDGTDVYVREVAKTALRHNAGAVILGHNHPSGNPEPSAADRASTARLKQALVLFEIRVLDHFIVAGAQPPTSLAARGWV